jgi:preprotein translocase subunit SecF
MNILDVSRIRYVSYCVSLIMIALFFIGGIYKKKTRDSVFLYSVEFSGGIQIALQIKTPENKITTEQIAVLLRDKKHIEGISIRHFGGSDFLVRIPLGGQGQDVLNASIVGEEIKKVVEENIQDSCVIISDVSFVGPGVGSSLRLKAILSIVIAFLMMFFYVWIRFKSWAFSIANSISLFHDILVVILMILWFDYEISLDIIAAILFILGYSINDTIVIFSRIRENIAKNFGSSKNIEKKDLKNIINTSLKETLRRTLLTSFFTTLVVVPLWLFGGSTLEPLSAAILLGIVFGTYSSIGIAAPILYDFYALL